jgi:two-component system copper resistance phosphate regulon response regulator CusR
MTMRVLVVEDERKTAEFIRKGLAEKGFVVDVAHDGEAGLGLALYNEYDCLVLDVMLPRMDGWSLLAEYRREGREAPVLFLTARDDVADRVKGLESGADDYLVKPFAFSELLARIRSLLRRPPARQPDVTVVGDLSVDHLGMKAARGGQPLHLAPKEFALLSLMARRAGEVLSRTLILEQIWDMNFDSDANVVDVAVRRLRRRVDDPFPVKLIHTVRGAGYVLENRGGEA